MPLLQCDDGVKHFRDLIRLTLIGISQHGPSFLTSGEREPEDPQHDEGNANCIVITGEPESVADLALYWNLRSQRIHCDPFPLWMPLDVLNSQEGKSTVDVALSFLDPSLKQGPGLSSTLYILSGSISSDLLETGIADRFPEAALRTNNLHNFLTGNCTFDFDRSQREVYFDEGRVRVPLSRPPTIDSFASRDRVTHEIEIEHARLPNAKPLQTFRLGNIGQRITRNGALEGFIYPYSWLSFVNINVPDGWSILTSMLEEVGYECMPSDKGRLTLGQLALFGEIEDIEIIASSKVHSLLRDLSRGRGGDEAQERLFSSNRPTAQFSQISSALGRDVAPALVKSLVDRGILLRGTKISCPRCQLDIWYEVDRMGRSWRCDGCQVSLPIPLGPDVTQWSYRVNELYAVGHDQGTITHLLALYNLYPPVLLGNTSLLGYYPGVVLKSKMGSTAPVDTLEIDAIGIRDGKLILVECKDSGGALGEDEAFRLADVANHLDCSRLIFITPTTFSNAESLCANAQERCQARVEAWEARDIFDQSTSDRIGGLPDDQPDEVRASRYLERLAALLDSE